ncbi:unnamed protein product, partial [Cylicostephanus goldi]
SEDVDQIEVEEIHEVDVQQRQVAESEPQEPVEPTGPPMMVQRPSEPPEPAGDLMEQVFAGVPQMAQMAPVNVVVEPPTPVMLEREPELPETELGVERKNTRGSAREAVENMPDVCESLGFYFVMFGGGRINISMSHCIALTHSS